MRPMGPTHTCGGPNEPNCPSLTHYFTAHFKATGEGAINIKCVGNYSAKLVVRDGAGKEVTIRSWNFTVRMRDTDVPAYGPNGRGCSNGKVVDGEEMDGAFTCDCGGTRCVRLRVARSVVGSCRCIRPSTCFPLAALSCIYVHPFHSPSSHALRNSSPQSIFIDLMFPRCFSSARPVFFRAVVRSLPRSD